ncbi:MAG: type III secretion system inner membrane ring subunit SctD [Chlamydiales bacterium]|nr:type III secretion system inner membrane ring subunit SctD [Chlamydiales bacterium]
MTAELIAIDGALRGVILSLEKGREWVLGRDPESCHIVVEDSKVERKALIIRLGSEGYSLESLSDAPVFVNGKEVKQASLSDGDVLKIGDTTFSFYLTKDASVASFGGERSEQFEKAPKIDLTNLPGGEDESEEFASDEAALQKPVEDMVSEGLDKEEVAEAKPVEEMVSEGEDYEEVPQEKEGEEMASEGHEDEVVSQQRPAEEMISEGKEEEKPVEKKPAEEMVSDGKDAEDESWEEEEAEEWDVEEFAEEEKPGVAFEPTMQEPPKVESEPVPAPPVEKQSEEFVSETLAEEEYEEEPLFSVSEENGSIMVDLTPSVRFLLKVIAGPNTGAEIALEMGREYLIGTDANACDIVFHDLSVSREHARLLLSESGELMIEDLSSRNGVLIDQEQILGKVPLAPNLVVSIGTTAFFIIDREAPQETIVAPTFEAPKSEEKLEQKEPSEEEAVIAAKQIEEPKKPPAPIKKQGIGIYMTVVAGLAVLLGIGMVSLFQTKELKEPPKNYMVEIQEAVQDFPSVKYTYSPTNNRLFLVGHVATGVEKNELFYNLNALTFLNGVEDHVVNDEAVWQEMNILLSKQKDFKGVSMHSPRPAVFVLSGYLKNEKQASDLIDWINIHFNYLNLLENRVVVEELVIDEISSQLIHNGFGAVAVSFSSGEVTLAGYVGSAQAYEFERLVHEFRQLPGVRQLQNFVVVVAPEEQVIDLNQRYPGRYKVTGYSKHGDVSINVVVNGRILSRGDVLDNMTLTSIQPHAIFFEKDGLKYKLEYNK